MALNKAPPVNRGLLRPLQHAAGRARARGLRADHIARARKVDKAKFLNEFDQEMLLGKTFNTGADRART